MTAIEAFPMREKCGQCGCPDGVSEDRNGQDVVRCSWCNTYAYCRPRAESGREVRTVRTRPNIKPSQRARILERDNYTCVACHTADGPMHIGHLLSVEDGKRVGATEAELYADENLAAMCEQCNLGQGEKSVSVRLIYAILQARVRWSQ